MPYLKFSSLFSSVLIIILILEVYNWAVFSEFASPRLEILCWNNFTNSMFDSSPSSIFSFSFLISPSFFFLHFFMCLGRSAKVSLQNWHSLFHPLVAAITWTLFVSSGCIFLMWRRRPFGSFTGITKHGWLEEDKSLVRFGQKKGSSMRDKVLI